MAKKTILAFAMVGLGVIIGLVAILRITSHGSKAGIAIPFLVGAVGLIITGTFLSYSRILDRMVNPILDEIQLDIEDDLQDIKSWRFTTPLRMAFITGIAALIFTFFVFSFHKLEALWGGIPVAIPTILGMGALAFFMPKTKWFQNKRRHTPIRVFCIPLVGLILTLIIGIGTTENVGRLVPALDVSGGYYTRGGSDNQTGGGIDLGGGIFDFVDSFSGDDDSGLVFLVILLIVLVFILLLGSATIPHFWLLSGSLMLGLMALIAIRDLRLRQTEEDQDDRGESGEPSEDQAVQAGDPSWWNEADRERRRSPTDSV